MSSQTDGAGAAWPARTGVSRTELDPTSFLDRTATIHPDRVAVVDGDVRRTYAQLRERVNRLASALRARGLERHDRVAALCPNVPELLELHHAVPAAGGVLVAINVRLGAEEVGYILEHSGFRLLFADRELEPLLGEGRRGPRGRVGWATSTSCSSPPATRRAFPRCCATRRSRSRSTTRRARRAARRASSTRTAGRT